MRAGSRIGKNAYVWTDKRGGAHIIELGTRIANSEISFVDDTNQRLYYSIPTIQNLEYTQAMTLPSHPTLDGSYIQQLAKEEVGKLTFDLILAESMFTNFDSLTDDGTVEQRDLTTDEFIELQENENISIDEILTDTGMYTVKDLITILEDLKNNSRVFTITTNSPMNDLLDNLVVTNISYVHDKESRYVVACSIEAHRVHFGKITYATLTSAEVAGLMTEADATADASPIIAPAELMADGDEKFNYEVAGSSLLGSAVAMIWTHKKDIHKRFGDALQKYCDQQGMPLPISYIISEEIDRNKSADAPFELLYSFQFPSSYGTGMTQESVSSDVAPYMFYTKPIKFTFGKRLERKATEIYSNVNTLLLADAIDQTEDTVFDIRGGVVNMANVLDREAGIYDLVETYKSLLGATYNTEKRLHYKDINKAMDAAPELWFYKDEPVAFTTNSICGSNPTKRPMFLESIDLHERGRILGYKIKDSYPPISIATETAQGAYSSAKNVKQADEIYWEFGSLQCQWDIRVNAPHTVNKDVVKGQWASYGVGANSVTVHYGVLFVGAKVLLILFNPKVMNATTRVNTNEG